MNSNQYMPPSSSSLSLNANTSNNPFLGSDNAPAGQQYWPQVHELEQAEASNTQQQQTNQQPYFGADNAVSNPPRRAMHVFPGGGNWPPLAQGAVWDPVAKIFRPGPNSAALQAQHQAMAANARQAQSPPLQQVPQARSPMVQQQQPQQFTQQQYPQHTGMNQYGLPQQYTGYPSPDVSQFDPYSNIGNQSWGQPASPTGQQYGQNQGQMSYQQPSSASTSYASPSPQAGTDPRKHPRDHIKLYRKELEGWEVYAWKQLLNSFLELKKAWDYQYNTLLNHQQQHQMYGYPIDPNIQDMIRNARSNSDATAAAHFQMKEVYEGYKLSSDEPSRRRVREAMNSGLSHLPEWPQPQ